MNASTFGVGSDTHAQQTGNVMIAYERVLFDTKPDLVVVADNDNILLVEPLGDIHFMTSTDISTILEFSKPDTCPRPISEI